MDNMTDPFSEVLDLIAVKSSVYFQKDFCAPWGMFVSGTGFAQFHIVVRGTAVVVHDSKTIEVSAGDILLFPRGASHLISDPSQSTQMLGQEVISAMASGHEPFTEGDLPTRMICGHFEYDFSFAHPLLDELPEIVLLRAGERPMMDHLFSLVQLIVWETSNNAPGSDVVVRRLSDGLLVTIIRVFYETSDHDLLFYSGLSDERILPVLQAIHNSNAASPDIESLCRLAGMSRSSFLHHFKETVGCTAGAYATRWKLLKARASLAESAGTVETIGLAAGYTSASAFTRAFHNLFGLTPSEFRKTEGRS